MGMIERTGSYVATITEATYGETQKGLPQFVGKLLATKRYVTDKDEMAHFAITEPGWVDWNYDEEITAYLVLFNDAGPLKNYEQLQTATGWNGNDFQEIPTLVGKSVLIRVEENTWDGKTSLQVKWIDAPDASPDRTIKQADAATVAAANNKWLKGRAAPAKPVTAAKPALPKPVASTAAPVASQPATSPSSAATPATPTAPVAAAPGDKAVPPKRGTKKAEPTPVDAAGVTQAQAWESVSNPAVKKTLDDTTIEDAWIAAAAAVAPGTEDKDVTPVQWAAIRDAVLKDIAARLA